MPIIILCEACMIYETSNHELFILIRSKSLFEGIVDNSDWQFHSIFNSSEQMKQENVYCSSGACTNLAACFHNYRWFYQCFGTLKDFHKWPGKTKLWSSSHYVLKHLIQRWISKQWVLNSFKQGDKFHPKYFDIYLWIPLIIMIMTIKFH